MKRSECSLLYPELCLSSLKIAVFSDASYANLQCGGSQGGYLVFLVDSCGKAAPISWSSKKVNRVARSTLAAETMAAVEALDAAYMVASILKELLGEKKNREIRLFVDNKSLFDAVKTCNLVSDKRLRVDLAAIREMIEKDDVALMWVAASYQLADVLTKNGASKTRLLNVLRSARLEY